MNKFRITPTPLFWDCAGLALIAVAFGIGWSLFKSANYKLSFASHQLEVNQRIERVKDNNQDVFNRVRKAPLAPYIKKQALKTLKENQDLLDEASEELIESQNELLNQKPDKPVKERKVESQGY